MKVWASATAIGFSMAYLACSSSPPSDGTYVPPAGGGLPGTAGAAPTAGSNPGTSGAPQTGGGADMGGAPGTSGASPMAGAAGAAPVAGAAGAAGAMGGGTAGAGGGTPGAETEVACPMVNGKLVDGHCSSGVTYPTYTGFDLALVEDFPVAVDLNADPVFTWSDGIPNDSQTNFAEANITFANGRMILTAQSKCAPANNNVTCYAPRTSFAESYSDEPIPRSRPGTGVTSGEFRTKYNNYRYGRYEVKYTAPSTTMGNFLSTMFVFRTPTNIAWNEVDNELEPNQGGKQNLNTVNAPAGAKGYPGGDAQSIPIAGLNIATEHIYAFNWTAAGITWYVDNNPTPTYTHAPAQMPPIPNLSAKIMMNLWV
ncbi:MAG TPA: glycoside hydrolase family 16 protein, partial [Polyangiaceae bacterium]